MERKPTFLCLASNYKGRRLIQEAHALGARTILLTRPKTREEAWPSELDEIYFLPALNRLPEVLNAVSYLAHERRIDAIVPLDEHDVEMAAHLREHFRMPGMGDTQARRFRDKLAMRVQAREAGLAQPEFVPIHHYPDVDAFTDSVPPPWFLKPRSEAGSLGIKKVGSAPELWRHLESLGDMQSHYLVERAVDGPVCHVDSIVWNGKVVFARAHEYGTPPFELWNYGGVFSTHTVDQPDLLEANARVLKALGLENGIAHTEMIRCQDTGELYFLEVGARVGGANIDVLVEETTGVCLWREWVRMELALLEGKAYRAPKPKERTGALLCCLARQERPDLSAYSQAVWTLDKPHHAGLVVAGPESAGLMAEYRERMRADFLAVLPPLQSAV